MSMPEQIRTALNQYVRKIKEIYGNALQKVILYGSYSRGDFNADSDKVLFLLYYLGIEWKDSWKVFKHIGYSKAASGGRSVSQRYGYRVRCEL